jgi:acyl-CoA synthetase (AMP-forming)/AMP-acid ligase II
VTSRPEADVDVPDGIGLTFGAFVSDLARLHGERPALWFEGRTWTFTELETEVRRVAKALLAANVVKGTRVALLAGNRPEWIFAAWAIGMVGGVVIPVSTFSAEDERDYVLRHSDSSLLIVQDALLKHRFAEAIAETYPASVSGTPFPELPFLRRVVELKVHGDDPPRFGTWDDFLEAGAVVPDDLLDAAAAQVAPPDAAIVIYTSGTTAHPKAVMHNQRTPVLQSWRVGDHVRLTADDRVASTFPFFWSAGFAMGMGAVLSQGACLLVQEWFDTAAFLALIEGERATTVFAAPHQDAALAEHEDAATRDLSSLRKVGATSRLRAPAGHVRDDWGTVGAYGLSETFTFASSVPGDAPAELRALHGKPFPGVDIKIVDDEGAELPPGAYGEICVRGLTVMDGYYKVPREEVFDSDGYFHTSDAGAFVDDGNLHWTGRLSGLIKTGGANVSPVELETELAHWGRLRTAMAVGIPHPTLGQAVVVCVTQKIGEAVTEDEVRAYLKERVSSYKVPRRVLFVDESELSFTSSQQKVQLEKLRALASERLARDDSDPDWAAYLGGTTAPAAVTT